MLAEIEGEKTDVHQTRVAYGIFAHYAVDVLDNTVSGVLPSADLGGNGDAYGIFTNSNFSGSISGNRVRGLVNLGDGEIYGIYNVNSGRISLVANQVVGNGSAQSIGLRCGTDFGSTKDNLINGFATDISTCTNNGGNVGKP